MSRRDLEDAYLINALIDAHDDDPEFGYRFLADEVASGGLIVGERRIRRLCSQQKLWRPRCATAGEGRARRLGRRCTTTTCSGTSPRSAPIRSGSPTSPSTPTLEGKLYCCAIKDLLSNRIVGYAIDERMIAQLAVTAMRTAVARRQPTGVVVVHSDRGSQFRARSFRAALTTAGLQGSMGRVASAGDNAAMESWHALLQKNVLDRRGWRTRDELHQAIVLLGRTHLPPSPAAARPGQGDSGRVRTRLYHSGRYRSMISPNRRQPKLQQSHGAPATTGRRGRESAALVSLQ